MNRNTETSQTEAAKELVRNLARIRSTRNQLIDKTDQVLAWGNDLPATPAGMATDDVARMATLRQMLDRNLAADAAQPASDFAGVVDSFYSGVMHDVRRATNAVNSLRGNGVGANAPKKATAPPDVVDVEAKVVSNHN
jgi:hypothetical protein